MQNCFFASRVQLEYDSAVVGSPARRSPVEIPRRIPQKASVGREAVRGSIEGVEDAEMARCICRKHRAGCFLFPAVKCSSIESAICIDDQTCPRILAVLGDKNMEQRFFTAC